MSRNVRIKIKKKIITRHNESLGRLCSDVSRKTSNITRSPIQFLRTVNKGNWPSRVSKPENLSMNLYALVNSSKIQTVIQSSCFFAEASTLKMFLIILRDRSNTNTKDNRKL